MLDFGIVLVAKDVVWFSEVVGGALVCASLLVADSVTGKLIAVVILTEVNVAVVRSLDGEGIEVDIMRVDIDKEVTS